jgi:hypothetical protein
MVTQVFPVIHYDTIRQALDNAAIAERCGCPGVFLISMDGRDDELDQAIMAVKHRYTNLKVGGNFLSLGALDALKRCLDLEIDATWVDSPGVNSAGAADKAFAIRDLLLQNPGHRFFGSVAFKYQAPERDPAKAALNALQLGMIPTTSGTATGVAADTEKLATMKRALGANPLGLASGVSPENVHLSIPYVDYIMVSTHISETPDSPMFSEQKLQALMAVVNGTAAPAQAG